MSLGRMKVGRQAGRHGEYRKREGLKEGDKGGGVREESERERGRLASQFPAARYIYEAHKVASTTAYIAA